MALTVQDLRARIAASITGTIGPDGWRESRYVVDLFPTDGRDMSHLCFAVGVPATQTDPRDRQSGRGGAVERGTQANSTVLVRWGFRLRADAQVEDYSDALNAEATLVATVLATDPNPGLSLTVTRMSRGVAGDGTLFVGAVEFLAVHRLSLAPE